MADRYDLISPREYKTKNGEQKTYWHKVGTAFKREKGGYMLKYDSLPLSNKDGECSVLMVPPKDKTVTADQLGQAASVAELYSNTNDLNDLIPF